MAARNFTDFFTRASAGRYFNSAGALVQAAANEPRYDYDPATLAYRGLLIEEARTNLQPYSSVFSQTAWSSASLNGTLTATALAPDGTSTATLYTENSAASVQHLIQSVPVALAASSSYTLSLFAKRNGRDLFLGIETSGGTSGGANAVFNLTAGTVGLAANLTGGAAYSSPAASITPVGGGWYRCALTFTVAAITQNHAIDIRLNSTNNSSSFIYTGDGASGLYVWGSQLEAGTFPTSYIPTASAQVTRSADTAGLGLGAAWYNQVEGTLYAEVTALNATSAPSGGSSPSILNLYASADQGNNNIRLFRNQTDNLFKGVTNSSGVQNISTGAAVANGAAAKVAFAFKAGDSAICLNGATPVTHTMANMPPGIDRLCIGAASPASGFWNCWLRDLRYYPRRLSNAELQALTT